MLKEANAFSQLHSNNGPIPISWGKVDIKKIIFPTETRKR